MAVLVVENPDRCPISFGDVTPVSARSYLTDSSFMNIRGSRIVNICQSFRYQSLGYYVSLLAEARGHKAIPTTTTIQDMKTASIINLAGDEMEELISRHLRAVKGDEYLFNVYFGKTPVLGMDALALRLFKFFPAPFFQATFQKNGQWFLSDVSALSPNKVPEAERAFASAATRNFLTEKRSPSPRWSAARYDMAILVRPGEQHPPSNSGALRRFIKEGEKLGMSVDLIHPEDSRRLVQYDGLLIRETTRVDHHTYRMARRAKAEGLVVIDDPASILRCSNKVYLAELLTCHCVETPKTVIVHTKNKARMAQELELPCILKQPEGAFSQGVVLARTREQLMEEMTRLLRISGLIIAQEFVPTPFDWRVGVLDKKPLFVCKYFMAGSHWQIIEHRAGGTYVEGFTETLAVRDAPKNVVKTALKAASLIGDGLYGVDLKEKDGRVMVVEINDNPNIDHGIEDEVLEDELYRKVMGLFLERMELRSGGGKRR